MRVMRRLDLSQFGKSVFLKLILYGVGGSGKTTFAYDFANHDLTAPVMGWNMGGNPHMILQWDKIPFILELEKPEDVDLPYQFLAAGQPPKHPFRIAVGLDPDIVFKTLVFDTFSDWQRSKIEDILVPMPNIISDARAPDAKLHGSHIQSFTLHHARTLLNQLPMHTIIVMQQQEVVDFTSGATSQRPFLYGASRDYVTAWAQIVGRMQMQKVKADDKLEILPVCHWMSSDNDGYAKNQLSPKLGKGMINPNATKFLDVLLGGVDVAN